MIPYPKEDYQNLFDVKNGEQISSSAVKERVETIVNEIDDIDSNIIDIVGKQMESVSELFERTIKLSQKLFENLMKIKEDQMNIITAKKDETVELLSKLEATFDYIRKL